ncbi:MAG: cation:proton antiporter [Bacteroidia bacterium]|nr:cation:proton antiporter [Bacteroidia bacterium]
MEYWINIITYGAAFAIVAIASKQISKVFQKLKLPLITGLIVIGMIAGPYLLKMFPREATGDLGFINDISLAFIAFAAGAEMYFKELRSRMRSIVWMTAGQLAITFILGGFAVWLMAGYIPFMKDMGSGARIAVALLAGTIFVARSPSSAIAIINEMRAKGPFTATAIGVTVMIDVLVIILFTICFSFADTLILDSGFHITSILFLLVELAVSVGIGIGLGKVLEQIMRITKMENLKAILILVSGFSIYLLSHYVRELSLNYIGHEVYLEPLLICITGSFVLTNYSKVRPEWLDLLHKMGPYVYVAFFTLTGASLSLDIILEVWDIALILFLVRMAAMMVGGFVGGSLARDPIKFNLIAWMPYITQAGVALGLATLIAAKYPTWGPEFATVIIAVIVLNQVVGPPFFKWAITFMGEDHSRAELREFDGIRDAIIFGLESQSIALARQLIKHGWEAKIVTIREIPEGQRPEDVEVIYVPDLTPQVMKELDSKQAEAIVGMLSDEENFRVLELAYENLGTRDLIVRLNDRANLEKFHELGARIVEPNTAIVSLLDHFVRSPEATSLLLGLDENQDTVELEVLSPDLHGMALRDLRLPADVIVLGLKRGGQMLISHGYTRLRKGDNVTLVGSNESLEKLALRFAAGK